MWKCVEYHCVQQEEVERSERYHMRFSFFLKVPDATGSTHLQVVVPLIVQEFGTGFEHVKFTIYKMSVLRTPTYV